MTCIEARPDKRLASLQGSHALWGEVRQGGIRLLDVLQGKLPELGYATWQWFKLDNAKANLADDVRHALAEFIGCFIDAGPPHTPDDRPYIERFFGSVAANLSSRLPGYTQYCSDKPS